MGPLKTVELWGYFTLYRIGWHVGLGYSDTTVTTGTITGTWERFQIMNVNFLRNSQLRLWYSGTVDSSMQQNFVMLSCYKLLFSLYWIIQFLVILIQS